MYRSLFPSAGIVLTTLLAMPDAAWTQSPTVLSPVEVAAPPRHAARQRAARDSRSATPRVAPRGSSPVTVSNAAATPGARIAQRPVGAASEKNIGGAEVNARPLSRPAEALEVAPGLIITQHSGDGKANQYFLRGVNLDHGTDLAITVDGMPVNMRSHGHGQGYADVNFLIPELIGGLRIRKGPYFADEGDFSSVGAIHVSLID